MLRAFPDLKVICVTGPDSPEGCENFDQALDEASNKAATAETCADETAFWLYSSGSTGKPKGVRHLHASLMQTAKLFGQNVLGIREDDVVYSAAKLFFAYGLGNAMSFPMSVGATTVLLPGRPTPEAVIDVMRSRNPSVFYGVPTLYAAMLAHPELVEGAGSSALRLCVSAGEALLRNLASSGRPRSAVKLSTALARRKCCTSSSPTGPVRCVMAQLAFRYLAMRPRSSMQMATRSEMARLANSSSRAPRLAMAIGTNARRRAPLSLASGCTPTTTTGAARTAVLLLRPGR